MNIFNLNHPGLIQQRRDIAFAVIAYKDYLTLQETLNEIEQFESFIKSIW